MTEESTVFRLAGTAAESPNLALLRSLAPIIKDALESCEAPMGFILLAFPLRDPERNGDLTVEPLVETISSRMSKYDALALFESVAAKLRVDVAKLDAEEAEMVERVLAGGAISEGMDEDK